MRNHTKSYNKKKQHTQKANQFIQQINIIQFYIDEKNKRFPKNIQQKNNNKHTFNS